MNVRRDHLFRRHIWCNLVQPGVRAVGSVRLMSAIRPFGEGGEANDDQS